MEQMRYNSLGSTGLRVSEIGFGAATLGDEYGKADPREMAHALNFALDNGINIIDVAPFYGRRARRNAIRRNFAGGGPGIHATNAPGTKSTGSTSHPRASDEVWTSRCGGCVPIISTSFIFTTWSSGASIRSWRNPFPRCENSTPGKTRFIGITGLALKMLRDLAEEAPVDCILSYCRYTLLNPDLDLEVTPFAREHGVGLLSASLLHAATVGYRAPPWHPAPAEVKEAARKLLNCASPDRSARPS